MSAATTESINETKIVGGKTLTISDHLQSLIDNVNGKIKTLKSEILEIYETAKLEGFTPLEARMLIKVKVIDVSDGYLRRILPDEAKDQSKVRHKLPQQQEIEEQDDEDEFELETPQDFIKKEDPEIPSLPNNIVDAETTELKDLPEPKDEIPVHYEGKDLANQGEQINKLLDQIQKLTKENTELRMKQIGTLSVKFDFEYDYEMPSGDIVPFIVTVFPDKKDGYIRLNKAKIEANERKEAKKK